MSIFDLNEPNDLYRIVHEVYEQYVQHPTERDFLFLILGFTHLREWISGCGHGEIESKQKKGQPLSAGEKFFLEIYELPSFRVVQELCNRGKHRVSRHPSHMTTKSRGLQAGLARAGDRTDQTYFLIDGIDSRDYFIELIKKYNSWFSSR